MIDANVWEIAFGVSVGVLAANLILIVGGMAVQILFSRKDDEDA